MASLEDVLKDFERRISNLEKRQGAISPSASGVGNEWAAKPETSPPINKVTLPEEKTAPEENTGSFFGIVGIAFLLLAAIFFLKLSIDSGWLTPVRQVVLSAFFGLTCLFLPHYVPRLHDSYGALLSGFGAAVLHLTWLGAYELHHLLDPGAALVMASAVGALSLLLNNEIGDSAFVLVAVSGTYLAGPLIGYRTGDFVTISKFFLVWNLSYSALSFALRKRDILLVASFLAVLTTGSFSISHYPLSNDLAASLLMLQALQLLIFAVAMAGFSVYHRHPLKNDESWSVCLLLLIYYAHVYSLLSTLSPILAPFAGIALGLGVLAIYQWAQSLMRIKLTSTGAITSFAALVLTHSLFFKLTPDEGKPLFSLALAILMATGLSNDSRFWKYPARVAMLAIGYGALLTFSGIFSPNLTLAYHLGFGFGALFFASGSIPVATGVAPGRNASVSNLLLSFGHIEMLCGLYRLSLRVEMSGSLFVSLSWGAYALAVLAWAWAKRDRIVGQSAILILAAVSLKAAFYDVIQTGNLARVLSLLASGAVLYGCGWIFRQMQMWQSRRAG